MHYNTPGTPNVFNAGRPVVMQLYKGLATPQECREATNRGSLKPIFANANFSFDIDFTTFVAGGPTGQRLTDLGPNGLLVDHYGGWTGSSFF